MNKLRKTLLIFFATMTALIAPSAMNAQSGSWSDESNRDTSWGSDYASASEFTINSHEQLAQFAYLVNQGYDFTGKTVTLNDAQEEGWGGQVWTNDYYEMDDYLWVPIGTIDNPFNGTFNGNGKDINYLSINDSQATYQGFFGYIGSNGSVINTTVRMSEITADSKVGSIAGYNNGTMTNCVVTDITITGSSYAGAIVGQNVGTMTTCYAITVNVPAIGGATTGSDITGQAERLWRITGSNIEVSVGTQTGTTVGHAEFYDDGIQYNFYHYYKTGATATLTYTKPGYDATFSIESGEGASISGNVVTMGTSNVVVSATTTVADWDGSGESADDPFIIYNREQFDLLANRVNGGTSDYSGKFFRLENDIDYDGIQYYVAIGTSDHPFAGTFDGNGHSVEGPQINLVGISYQGVFGYNNGTIKNLKVTDPYIRGGDCSGGIAGYNAGIIENCRVDYSRGVFYGEDNHHSYGGIAGYNRGYISHCISAATVGSNINASFSVSKVGGIVGHNASSGNVEYCLYLGRLVDGTEYVGAIAGMNEGTLYSNLYHHNGYATSTEDNIGIYVFGVGVSDHLTGADALGAEKAKVVKLPKGGSQPYGATVNGTPIYETTNNPNGMPLSVYPNGILFRDTYFANYNYEIGSAFYTTASTIELTATNVPEGFVASLSTESDGASFDGNILTLGEGSDVVEVTVNVQRIPTGWLADGVRAESFSTTGENSITIMSASELALLAYNVNFEGMTYEGYTITLDANIDLVGNTWEPIGLTSGSGGGGYPGMVGEASGFLGIFDGANHTISNMNTGNYGTGLFATISSTVQNLAIEDATVSGTYMVGIVAGSCSGTIQNCRVVGGSVSFATNEQGYNTLLGGLVGICEGGTITGCSVTGTTIDASVNSMYKEYIGGIVGVLSGSRIDGSGATLTNNIFSGTIILGADAEYYGAIAGDVQDMSQYYGEPNTIANNYYTTGTIGGINNEDVTENNGAVRGVTREIAGYGEGNDKWAFIASPVVGSINPETVGNIFSATEYDLYSLNPSNTMWENYKNEVHTTNFNLVNGMGYLYATKETKNLVFTGTFNTGTEKVIEGLNAGYNLVGNPFTVDAYVSKPYYTLNGAGSAIVAQENSLTTPIAPCYGVIVEVEENENVIFSTTPLQSTVNNGNLEIALSQTNTRSNAMLDNAIVSFNEGTQLGKFYFGKQNANIYLPQGGEEYAIVSVGADVARNVSTEIPINFKANENGTYTLSVNPEGVEMDYLHLIDNFTGADVDLLAVNGGDAINRINGGDAINRINGGDAINRINGGDAKHCVSTYTFEAKTTDLESRFKLVFAANNENGPSTGSGAFAFISNGNIVVNGEGTLQVLDVMGRVIVCRDAMHCVSTNGMPAGVYVLRLINGNDVKTQKIVVR